MNFRKKLALLFAVLITDAFLGYGLSVMLRADGTARERHTGTAVSAKARIRSGGVLALTFDDGPNAAYTEPLLDGLRERGVRASFFLLGDCIRGNEAIVKRMCDEGHLIGVHGMSHTDLTRESTEEALEQIAETRAMIEAITGKTPEYVRPPYGNWNEELNEATDMTPVFWSVDSLDWKLRDTWQIVRSVEKDAENGAVILMHDEFDTSVEAALQLVDNLTASGYTFVTVDELTVD